MNVRVKRSYEKGKESSESARSKAEQANGSILDFYANGGMRENHVAQIAPAGAWRVWAEDETGGEAYIPLARQKRTRSLQIWAETGRRLGVGGYANGGIAAGGPAGGSSPGGGPRRVAMTITNWKTGEGYFSDIADERVVLGISANENHNAAQRRANRR